MSQKAVSMLVQPTPIKPPMLQSAISTLLINVPST
uniref:Uncharacterized protein n=1 Tax=Nelumbo nucifera TaxID=4432 RepID=A0A822ZWM1_NELNU|nr:TPA_asm: hypothetical protein HUJ06_004775 [Nelumbo nucifera]DAD47649.1 TPA_asm: hypothetical protein HUJ06_017586 [Nelumbo nucifera]